MSRPTFHNRYIVSATERRAKDQRPDRNGPRLLDCIKVVCNDDLYFYPIADSEFMVFDMQRRERAICELPAGGTVKAEAMIASYFAATPVRLTDRIWAV